MLGFLFLPEKWVKLHDAWRDVSINRLIQLPLIKGPEVVEVLVTWHFDSVHIGLFNAVAHGEDIGHLCRSNVLPFPPAKRCWPLQSVQVFGASVKQPTETRGAQTWTCRRLDPESRKNRPCRWSGGPQCWSKGLPSGRLRAASSSQFAAGLWCNPGTANRRWFHKSRVPARLHRVTNMVQRACLANQQLKALRKQTGEPSAYSQQLQNPFPPGPSTRGQRRQKKRRLYHCSILQITRQPTYAGCEHTILKLLFVCIQRFFFC